MILMIFAKTGFYEITGKFSSAKVLSYLELSIPIIDEPTWRLGKKNDFHIGVTSKNHDQPAFP